jgi:hypothetical protein
MARRTEEERYYKWKCDTCKQHGSTISRVKGVAQRRAENSHERKSPACEGTILLTL